VKLTEQQLNAGYVGGPDEVEAAINHTIEQLLEIAIPDATARQQWREQNPRR
jgi:hypothetical protein